MADSTVNACETLQDVKPGSENLIVTNGPKTGNGEMQALLVEDYPSLSPAMLNLMSTLDNPTIDEITVLLLFILTVETGFVPYHTDNVVGDEECRFNIRRLKSLTASPKLWRNEEGVYHLHFVLSPFPDVRCHLVCVPMGSSLLVNSYSSCSNQSFAMVLSPADFVALYPDNQIIFKRLKSLSLNFKNKVIIPIRTVMLNEIHQTTVGLFSLPVEVLLNIISFLQVPDFAKWSSTCKYFFHSFFYDEHIWKQYCETKFLRPSALRSKETHREYYQRKIKFRNTVSRRFP